MDPYHSTSLVSGVHHSDLIFLDIKNNPQLSLVNMCHHCQKKKKKKKRKKRKGLCFENQVNVRWLPGTQTESMRRKMVAKVIQP